MSKTQNIVIDDLNNRLTAMRKEKLDEWREQLNTIHNEIEQTVNDEFDKSIKQDQSGEKPFSERSYSQRESMRYLRHIVHHLQSCIDCIDLCGDLSNE